jgi:DNA-binding transcriptional ArsR family regulator
VLDLHHLRTFVVMVATCSFTRTARELGYSQSTVTLHIKVLEREFGALLFERKRFSKTNVLTPVGRQVFEYAVQLLALADEAKSAVQSLATGGIAFKAQEGTPPLTTMVSEDTMCPRQSKDATSDQADSPVSIKAGLHAK